MAEEKVERKGVGKSEKLFAGIVLTIIGLLGLGYGGMWMGGMMGMMGYGYGYYYPISIIVTLVFLGVTLFGLYLVYDSVRE